MRYCGAMTMLMTMMLAGMSCSRPSDGSDAKSVGSRLPKPKVDSDTASGGGGGEAIAVFAGGCFWCVEAVFEQLPGVKDVVSGYAGGSADTADYHTVSSGNTAHAEAVKIVYDPSKTSYGELLRIHFATHDPTQLNRQGPDVGTQYRSAIFYTDEQQKHIAEAYIKQLNESGNFRGPLATTVEPLDKFYLAEDYHQDFARLNPDHPYIRYWVPGKLDKLHKAMEADAPSE